MCVLLDILGLCVLDVLCFDEFHVCFVFVLFNIHDIYILLIWDRQSSYVHTYVDTYINAHYMNIVFHRIAQLLHRYKVLAYSYAIPLIVVSAEKLTKLSERFEVELKPTHQVSSYKMYCMYICVYVLMHCRLRTYVCVYCTYYLRMSILLIQCIFCIYIYRVYIN